MTRHRSTFVCLCMGCLAVVHGCAGSQVGSRSLREANTYLKHVAFDLPGNERVVLRWPESRMPLRVHLPEPPAGMFEDPDAIHGAVRDGVVAWTDVARKDLPSFVFVDDPRDADIPIVWASAPDGDWYVAHCAYDIDVLSRRFGVSRILVTASRGDGRAADAREIHRTLLHEMGHALGLGGHSPEPGDVMYAAMTDDADLELTDRDRRTLAALYARPIGSRVLGARSDRGPD